MSLPQALLRYSLSLKPKTLIKQQISARDKCDS